ncbi:hypothetical protein [Stappia sp. 28M-7]|uniref:hypothetical protein n=1 Tax=Stappia sp. 28M-7 TaxID=2762596 RepID=UPI00163C3101|nr:hypothetical protein [Stappia sp. 28M-7]MBC2860305.1 hypothetical protein [Stappia sp. 28M-7]
MATKVTNVEFKNIEDFPIDKDGIEICNMWKSIQSLSEIPRELIEKILIMGGDSNFDCTPEILFVGRKTLAQSVVSQLEPGSAAALFPLDYRQALRHGYVTSTHNRIAVSEIIETDSLSSFAPGKINYLRVILPTTMKGGLPIILIYSQLIPENSPKSAAKDVPLPEHHRIQKQDHANQADAEPSSKEALGI